MFGLEEVKTYHHAHTANLIEIRPEGSGNLFQTSEYKMQAGNLTTNTVYAAEKKSLAKHGWFSFYFQY